MPIDPMTHTEPAFQGLIGVARADITPPDGIHARNWGAATHDTALGVHRPLTATALFLGDVAGSAPLILLSLDGGWWRSPDDTEFVRGKVGQVLDIPAAHVVLCLTHTHAGASLCRADAGKPGGEHVAPYLEQLRETCARLAVEARAHARPATLTVATGACRLATNRDARDPGDSARYVTGFAPDAPPADSTLLVGRVTGDATGEVIATVVNYACHPTTLGHGNRRISPDYIGAMRTLVEGETGDAPCLFLQGASGELAPAEQYVTDTDVADRHGRTLGYAVLSALSALPATATRLRFAGVVSSGAPLGVWEREAYSPPTAPFRAEICPVPLPLKELPTRARLLGDLAEASDAASAERLRRRLQVRKSVGDGDTLSYPVWVWRFGTIAVVAHPGEAYSALQIAARAAAPGYAVLVVNVANGWFGYLPPAHLYAKPLYSTTQTPLAAGCLESVIAAVRETLEETL